MNLRNKEQVDKMSWEHQKGQQLSHIVQWNPMHVLKTNLRHRVHVSILEESVKSNVRAIFLTPIHKVLARENDLGTKVVALSAKKLMVVPPKRIKV